MGKHRTGRILLLALLVTGISSCEGCTDPVGDGGPTDAAGLEPDAGGGLDSGVGPGDDSGIAPTDGGGANDGGGSEPGVRPDGGEPDPLTIPLDDFCEGSGAVSDTGACAGEVAEETFRAALCACDGVEVGSQLTVDAFDSTTGPYNAGTALAAGDVGVNVQPFIPGGKVTIRGSLVVGGPSAEFGPASEVSGNLVVDGALTAANNSSAVIGRNAFINGNVAAGYAITGDLVVPPGATVASTVTGQTTFAPLNIPAPCACEEEEILDIAAFAQFGAANNDNAEFGAFDGGTPTPIPDDAFTDNAAHTVDLPCGRYYLSSVVAQQFTIHVDGRAVVFVGGDVSTSGLTIDFTNEDAELDVFIAGNLTIDSNATLGDVAHPERLRVYVAGDVDIQASASLACNLYAPRADVSLNASSDVYGSLFVNRAILGGNAKIHYDTAIRSSGDACLEPTPPDGGTPVDGGGTPTDGGTPGDAGTPADGGTLFDAGTPDAGVVPPVGCGNVCTNVCDATEACLVDDGVCGACRTDLDCCFPAICLNDGRCENLGG